MASTIDPISVEELSLDGHVAMQQAVKKGFNSLNVHLSFPEEGYTSPGGNIVIPPGSSVWAVLQAIIDHVDPDGL